MTRTVTVDRNRCISCGLCVSLAPEVFRFEEGKSFPYNPSGTSETRIQECINGCPVEAISWKELQ